MGLFTKRKLEVEIDEKDVQEHIRLSVAQALTKNPAALVEKIVNECFQKSRRSYEEPPFKKAMKKIVNEAAEEEFKKWLADKKNLIRVAIQKRFQKEEDTFLSTVADKIVDAMASSFRVNISLDIRD